MCVLLLYYFDLIEIGMTCCVAPVYLLFQETSIELVVIEDDGNVQSVCDQPVFGTIKDLAILPWNEKFRARDPQVCCSVCY